MVYEWCIFTFFWCTKTSKNQVNKPKIEGVRFADGGLGYRTTNDDQVQYFDKGLNLAKTAQIIDTTRQINN